MESKSVLVEIITPKEMFYSGQAEMMIVSTINGQEGFMAGHTWCCKLLSDQGNVRVREDGQKDFKTARIKGGGYVDIKDHFVVYTDEAEWA